MVTIVTRAGKGSALTWAEGDANITNLNNGKLENVVEDTTPQLGGSLDVNGNSIVSTSNGNINLTPNGSGKVVVSSQLDANLLKSTQSSGDEGGQIDLALASTNTTLTGGVSIDVYQNKLRIFETGGSVRGAYIDLSTAATGVGTDLLAGGGLANIVEDTTPQLGGDLDVNSFKLVSTANGNIVIEPNGTGDVILSSDIVQIGDVNASATLTTSGTGSLTLSTFNGTNTGTITITNGANSNINITPAGTGKTVVANINYKETAFSRGAVTSISLGSGVDGNVQTVTLTSTAFTVNGLNAAGASVTLFLTNNGSVSAITQGTGTWKWAGGSKALTATNGTVDVVSIYYDGTTNFATINKGFV